jgi:cytosine/adenosine deaminase-related metal-dependent hydrolase
MLRLTLLLLIAIAGSAASSAAQAPRCDSSPLVVTNTNVWTRDAILTDRDVVFRDGRVAAIVRAGRDQHAGLRRIDGTGHTLLPGLIDGHLHFTIAGGLPATNGPRTDLEGLTARQLVRSGVTSGRLHLATLDEAARLKKRSTDPCEAVPRLQVGGPGLSGALQKDYNNFQGVTSAEDAAVKIERARAAGLDWVAIHDADKFAPGVLDAVATTARKAGLRLMAAGSTPEEITAALRIRPDTLDYFDRTPEPRYAPAILDLIKAQTNLVLVPTPGVPYRTAEYLRTPALLERAANFDLLNEADRAFVLANAQKAIAGADGARAQRMMPSLPEKIRQLRALGMPMALGSDAGSPLQFPSGAIWWELEAWRSTGATHREALRAATDGGARVLDQGARGPGQRRSEIGNLDVGSRADFVLYRGNVEDGPFDGARVIAVGKGGVLFLSAPRSTIAARPRDRARATDR